ncbi:MAG: 4-hydroxyphenylacetate decarboxylase small subunit [Bacteroidales bacterium]
MKFKHSDCKFFANIDIAKGICRKSGQIVEIDNTVCKSFLRKEKCKFCQYFKEENTEGIGVCCGLSHDDWVYGELNAKTCSSFEEKNY